jgi:Outer membrane lipoprotein carrier protein LolA-like
MREHALSARSSRLVATAALAASLALAALSAPRTGAAEADSPELQALVRRLASMPGLSARFSEEKRLSLLRAPLVSEGTLHYAPPDRIARRFEKPAPSSWVVRGDELSVVDAGGVRHVDLGSQPALRAFVEALRLVLAGDLAALRARFEIEFRTGAAASPESWRLRLVPRAGPLQELVAEIEVTGVAGLIATLRVREAGGDETLDRFSDVDPARRYSESELAALFDVSAP